MLTLNSVTVVGRVLYEPDRGETATGKRKMVVEVETVEDVFNKEYVQHLQVVAWGYLAEKLDNMRQGDILMVQGRFQQRSYEGRDGTKHKVFDIVAREASFEPMGRAKGSKESAQRQAPAEEYRQAAPKVQAEPAPDNGIADEEIPF